jgi:DNA-binding MarR family transcriptional regulator
METSGVDSTIAADPLAVASRLRPVVLRLGRHLRREIADLGVTGIQVSLLAAVRVAPGVGPSDLAGREGLTAATLTAHIDRLEAAGFVERARGEGGDRRRVGLRITPAGSDLLDIVRSRRTAWLAERLATLTTEELDAVDRAIGPLSSVLEGPA